MRSNTALDGPWVNQSACEFQSSCTIIRENCTEISGIRTTSIPGYLTIFNLNFNSCRLIIQPLERGLHQDSFYAMVFIFVMQTAETSLIPTYTLILSYTLLCFIFLPTPELNLEPRSAEAERNETGCYFKGDWYSTHEGPKWRSTLRFMIVKYWIYGKLSHALKKYMAC